MIVAAFEDGFDLRCQEEVVRFPMEGMRVTRVVALGHSRFSHSRTIRLKVLNLVRHFSRQQHVVNQHQQPEHFHSGPRLLLAVCDAHMRYSFGVKTEEINVLCD